MSGHRVPQGLAGKGCGVEVNQQETKLYSVNRVDSQLIATNFSCYSSYINPSSQVFCTELEHSYD